jgi:probable F420-dependent oxidoreductase
VTTVGLTLPQLGPVVDTALLRDFAQQAEGMGFDSLWVQDHFLYAVAQEGEYGGSATAQPAVYQSVWAPTEVLAAVAGWTETVKLGTSILVAGNHWPAPLAARLATVDRLADGRLDVVGLSVGWSVEEHIAAGVDPRTRGKRMDEFVPALRACWGPDPVHFKGKFLTIPKCLMNPKPVSTPRLMSGMWSTAGLARTAAHFDLWNPGSLPIGTVQQMLHGINTQRPAGKNPVDVIYRAAMESTAGKRMSVADLVTRTVEVAAAGFEGVILETNFCAEIDSAKVWLDILTSLSPVIDAAATGVPQRL